MLEKFKSKRSILLLVVEVLLGDQIYIGLFIYLNCFIWCIIYMKELHVTEVCNVISTGIA
jgi:hypothetical protein